MNRFLMAVLAASFAASAAAQSPYLVTDLNTTVAQAAQNSDPDYFTESGGWVYFRANGDAGMELWKSDGTTTVQVKDIYPGATGSSPFGLLDLGGGVVLFAATHPTYGTELWRSDGTDGGTMLVKEFAAGSTSSGVFPMTTVGGLAIVRVSPAGGEAQLWATDGSAAGTELLAQGASIAFVTKLGSHVYFFAGTSLHRTDGTAAGTTVVKSGVTARAAVVAGTKIFFAGWDQERGYELWVTDGTEAGTLLVKDINPGPSSAFQTNSAISMAAVGSNVVFFARDGVHNWALWRSDGLAGNTVMYREFVNLGTSAVPPPLVSAAGLAFFRMSDMLWRTNGTALGTAAVNGPVSPITLAGTPLRLYFGAASSGGGTTHLWSSDGSDGGTAQISGAVILNAGSGMEFLANRLWFGGQSGLTGIEPWVSDGTQAGTQMLGNLAADPPPSSNPADFRGAQGQLFFTAQATGASSSPTLWRSDGTAGGTLELAPASLAFSLLTPWKNDLFFRAVSDQLWRSDGTAAGTIMLKDDATPGALFAGSQNLYFSGKSTEPNSWYSTVLWKSDGTVAGTTPLTGSGTGSAKPWAPTVYAEVAGRVFVLAGEPRAIWRTDGTNETTVKADNLPASSYYYSGAVGALVPMGGYIYYIHPAHDTAYALWRMAGTGTGGSSLVRVLGTPSTSTATQLMAAGSILYMIVQTAETGAELWRSDGTEAGTYLLKDIMPGAPSSNPTGLTALNGMLFFAANNGLDGVELWKSDGTTAGTVMVADIAPGAAWSSPESLAAADNRIWFSATNGATGVELWSSDGTAGGTAQVADLNPGSASSTPRHLAVSGNKLFFSALTSLGRELWAVQLSNASRFSIGDIRLGEGTGGTTNATFVITRGGDLSQPASVAFATGDGTATGGSDYVAQSGVASFGAGVATATVNIAVNGDAAAESVETFRVTISSPSAGSIDRNIGTALIEDDDQQIALAVTALQVATDYYYEASRTFLVSNAGPSTATNVQLRVSESPFDAEYFSSASPGCALDANGVTVCALGTLVAGETRTVKVGRTGTSSSGNYLYDTTNPPGRTVTASVTASEPEADLTNNLVAKMMSPDGSLMLPPFLTSGTNTLADYKRPNSSSGAVTIASSHASVVPVPSTIPAGTNAAQFTLQVGNVVGSTRLEATVSGYTASPIVVPIVSAGQTPKLATVFYTPYSSSVSYGEDLKITIRVSARMHDGTRPTGIVRVHDSTGAFTDLTLDANGSVQFVRTSPNPGQYTFRAQYLGDVNFEPLDRTLPPVSVYGISTTTNTMVPRLLCGSQVPAMFFVRALSSSSAPTGIVRVALNNGTAIDLTLVPTGKPSESSASHTFTLPAGMTNYSIAGNYVPSGGFSGNLIYSVSGSTACANITVDAVATASNRVTVTWTPAPGATLYEIHRTESGYSSGSFIGYAQTTTYIDTTVQPDRCYLYRVRTSTSATLSQGDIATTVMFSDDPIVAGVTRIRREHVAQLRTAINAMRTLAGLGTAAYSSGLTTGQPMTAAHTLELRQLLNDARTWIGKPTVTFSAPAPATGQPVRAAHVQELRNGTK